MLKEPIVRSLKTNNEFTFEEHKFGRLPKDQYPYTFVYEHAEEIKYNTPCNTVRFFFEGTKEINAGFMYRTE